MDRKISGVMSFGLCVLAFWLGMMNSLCQRAGTNTVIAWIAARKGIFKIFKIWLFIWMQRYY